MDQAQISELLKKLHLLAEVPPMSPPLTPEQKFQLFLKLVELRLSREILELS